MAIVIRYMCCLVFISRSSDLIQYGGIVTKANSLQHAQFVVCHSLDTCQLYRVFVFLAASKHVAHSNSYLKIFHQLLCNVFFKQTPIFNQVDLLY